MKYITTSVLLTLCIAAFGTAQSVSSENISSLPTIGEPADRFLSPTQEAKIGEEFLRNVYRSGAVLEDPEISDYIQHLGGLLTSSLGNTEFQYKFFVVNDNNINAFAVPGGYIGINAGLILASQTESELAGVLAHEIAHVSQRHIARRIADINAKQIPALGAVLAGILLAASSSNADAGGALLYAGIAAQQQQFLNFTRSNEIEADRIGLQILYESGFDPKGMSSFFKNLRRQRFGRIPDQFEFLLTHPLDNTRISEAENRIKNLPPQKHESSLNFKLIKSRLRAITSKEPKKLVREIEKNIAAKKTPDDFDNYEYSQALEVSGSHKKASKILKKLTTKDKENISYQLAYARSNHNLGNNKAAAKTLNKLLTLYPDNFSANYYYAETLSQLGKAAEGRDTLKYYLRKNPAPNLEVFRLLAELHENSGDPISSKQVLAEYYFNSGNYNAAIFQLRNALDNKNVDFVTRTQIERRLREILQITRS